VLTRTTTETLQNQSFGTVQIDAEQNVVLISIASVADPSLAPEGRHCLHAYLPASEPYEYWAGLDRKSEEYARLKEARSQVRTSLGARHSRPAAACGVSTGPCVQLHVSHCVPAAAVTCPATAAHRDSACTGVVARGRAAIPARAHCELAVVHEPCSSVAP
jgi:hypothetical protein